jgi:hypothetical protein
VNDAAGNPQKHPLASWLSAVSLLTTFAALAVMALASTIVINRLAQRQALARSELAVSSAREYLRRLGEGNLTAARSLAKTPALSALLRAPMRPALNSFCRTIAPPCVRAPASSATRRARSRQRATLVAWPELASRAPTRASALLSARVAAARYCWARPPRFPVDRTSPP